MNPTVVASPRRKASRSRFLMPQPFKHPQSGVYYLRRKVPIPLREAMGCTEYKVSLNTRDPSEAKRLFAEEFTRSEERFALARAQIKGAHVLGLKDMHILAGRWFRSEQDAMEASGRFEHWLVSQAADDGDTDDAPRPQSLREWLDSGPDSLLDEHVNDAIRVALKAAGVPLPTTAEAKAQLQRCFRERLLTLSDLALSRLRGDWVTAPAIPKDQPLSFEQVKKTTQPTQGKRLSDLFERYKSEKLGVDGDTRGGRRTVDACHANTMQFIQLMGDLSMSEISREVVHLYRDKVSLLPAKGDGLRSMSIQEQLSKG